MSTRRPDPLTPEERELAERLARIGPSGVPSPALDARILGAARTATLKRSSASPVLRRRWPALVGAAAALTLAIGTVWQLQPRHRLPGIQDEVPVDGAARRGATASDSHRSVAAMSDRAAPQAAASSPAATGAAPMEPPKPLRQTLPPQPSPLPPPPPAPAAPPVVFDDPSPIDTPAPMATQAAPPAPPAPVAPDRSAQVQRKAQVTADAQTTAVARQRESSAARMASFAEVADAGRMITVGDLPIETDQTLAPTDWIERIRQRREAGDTTAARASLDLLQAAHPRQQLPSDLIELAHPAAPDR